MLAAVVMVRVTVLELVPSRVTLVGLKVQRAPAGNPAVQLPWPEPEFVKLIVWVEPFTGEMVKVADADCPAVTEPGESVLAERVKSG
jgi:type II secretory pathway component PulM